MTIRPGHSEEGLRALLSSPVAAAVVVFLAAIFLYLPTLGHGFVWDDLSILMANPALGDWSQLGTNLMSDFFHERSGPVVFDYWRPLVVFSHMIDRAAFGDAAWGPHLVNMLLHAAASVFVLLVAYAWMPRLGFAVVAGLAFAAHPVHVEAVAWVSGRSDLLFGVFFSLALLADRLHGSAGRRRWLAISLVAFTCALASKEAAIVFPVLVAARAYLSKVGGEGRNRWLRVLQETVPSLATLAAFLWLRFGWIAVSMPGAVLDPTRREALFWTWWSAFFRYMELLVAPWKLTILHQLDLAGGWWEPRVLGGLLLFGVLAAAGWRLRAQPEAAFGLAALLTCLAPLSSFVIPISAQGGAEFPLAERFLYVPSIGFCLFAAWIVASWLPARIGLTGRDKPEGGEARSGAWRLPGGSSKLLVLGLLPALLLTAGAARTYVRIADWESDLTLFAAAVRNSPGSYLAHLNYASALAAEASASGVRTRGRDQAELAHRHYLEALMISPGNYRIHYDLGNLYASLGREQEAKAAFREALLLEPRLSQARINLGSLLARAGELEEALQQFEAAEDLLPRSVVPKVNQAHVLQMLGRHQEAIRAYEEALDLMPELAAALDGLDRAREALEGGEVD